MPVVKFFPFFVLAIGLLESKKRKRDIPKKEKEEQQESIAQIHEVKERCVA